MQEIKLMATGVSNLDIVLGGGIPLYSQIIIAGQPGTGKTILAQQMLFNHIRNNSAAKFLYITTLSEPMMKVIRYMQQFSFFDAEAFGNRIIYRDIGDIIRKHTLSDVADHILHLVEEHHPEILAIDSFKAFCDQAGNVEAFRKFCYNLSVYLASAGCTTFLVGEYDHPYIISGAEFTIMDGILYLKLQEEDNRFLRCLQVLKLRGANFISGPHAFTISSQGITLLPRPKPASSDRPVTEPAREGLSRVSTGIAGLDKMLGGGLIKGFAALVAGSSGTGKTTLGLQFLYQGLQSGERSLLIGINEAPRKLLQLAASYGMDLGQVLKEGYLTILHCPPVELATEELYYEVRAIVEERKPSRIFLDSLTDLEKNFITPTKLWNYIYCLLELFGEKGITTLLTIEVKELFGPLQITDFTLSIMMDTIILLRYVELASRITRAISVLKQKGTDHEKVLREYRITSAGMEVLEPFTGVQGLIGGMPTVLQPPEREFQSLLEKLGGKKIAKEKER